MSNIVKDLTFGLDARGDYAYFIEEFHFSDDEWSVDEKAALDHDEAIFIRVIYKGEQQRGHGWLQRNKIIQWG